MTGPRRCGRVLRLPAQEGRERRGDRGRRKSILQERRQRPVRLFDHESPVMCIEYFGTTPILPKFLDWRWLQEGLQDWRVLTRNSGRNVPISHMFLLPSFFSNIFKLFPPCTVNSKSHGKTTQTNEQGNQCYVV